MIALTSFAEIPFCSICIGKKECAIMIGYVITVIIAAHDKKHARYKRDRMEVSSANLSVLSTFMLHIEHGCSALVESPFVIFIH